MITVSVKHYYLNGPYPDTRPIPVSIPPAGTSSFPYSSCAANWENSKKGVLQENQTLTSDFITGKHKSADLYFHNHLKEKPKLKKSEWVKTTSVPWIQQSVHTLSRQELPTRCMKSSGFLSSTWISKYREAACWTKCSNTPGRLLKFNWGDTSVCNKQTAKCSHC